MKILLASLVLATSALPLVAKAEVHSNYIDSVIESCNGLVNNSQSTANSLCTNYLGAFISGALVYDSMLVDHINRDHKDKSDFLQRVYKTRLGISERSNHIAEGTPFCVPDNLTQKALSQKVVEQLPQSITSQEILHLSILNGLSEQFPCHQKRNI